MVLWKARGTIDHFIAYLPPSLFWQSLVRVVESSPGGNITCNSIVLFEDLLVSTTLPPVCWTSEHNILLISSFVNLYVILSKRLTDYLSFMQDDTVNLFSYAVLRLTPCALSSATSTWSYLRKGSSTSHVVPDSLSGFSGSAMNVSRDTSPSGHSQRYHVLRPLLHDKWSKGKDGFLSTEIWNTQVGDFAASTPMVWLQQTQERAYLCVYQQKQITVILLVPVSSVINNEQGITTIKQQFLENVSILSGISFSC